MTPDYEQKVKSVEGQINMDEFSLSTVYMVTCGFSGDSDCVVDQISLLTAVTVFLLSAGPEVCTTEPVHMLCLQRFTASMDSKDPLVSSRHKEIYDDLDPHP